MTKEQREVLLDELVTIHLAAAQACKEAEHAKRVAQSAEEYAQAAKDAAMRAQAILKQMKVLP